jgi:tetratricopeptide (TPR) repeat protein
MGVRVTLAENLVQWHIRTNNLTGAQRWLKNADRLAHKSGLSESERPRHKLTIKYYYGVKHIAKGDRNRAEMYFKETLEGARKINWQRGMIYAQQFLADIARAQGRYDEAERLLLTGLEVVERNKDRRRIAYYKRSLAYLALQQGRQKKVEEVIYWAQQALDDFERLGMQPEVNKLRHLLEHLKAPLPSDKTELLSHKFHHLLGHLNASSLPQPVEDVLQGHTDVGLLVDL